MNYDRNGAEISYTHNSRRRFSIYYIYTIYMCTISIIIFMWFMILYLICLYMMVKYGERIASVSSSILGIIL